MAYCTSDQVAEFLQRTNFSGTTTPTSTVVGNLISRNEKVIEERTNHAWQTLTVTDEYVDKYVPVQGIGIAFYLEHRSIKDIATGSGDKVEIYDGSNFIDYAATKTHGRSEDFFLDATNGVIYIRDRNIFYPKGNKFTYRYGESTVDSDIEKACILLTAIDILRMNDKSARFTDDGPSNRLSHRDRIDAWKEEVNEILDSKKEMRVL